MPIVKCNIVNMKNQDFMRNGRRYHLDANGICDNISVEDAKILTSFKDKSWQYIEEEKPVVITPKIIEASVEAIVENKDHKPSMQETIDMVLGKKKNKFSKKGEI